MRRLILVLCLVAVAFVVFLVLPLRLPTFTGGNAAQRPSYDEAVAGWERMVAATPPNIAEGNRPVAFLHGQPTEQVVVLLHGLSNAPPQFIPLAKILFERGHNVVIQRMPYHGESNTMATDWGRMTGQEMLDSANQAIDLARGLGKHVTVAGLSVNGAVAAWVAQNRSDVDRTILLSPFMVPKGLPRWATPALANTLATLPNFFVWWDAKLKENLPGPKVYPRFPTRVIGQTMLLSLSVLEQSETKPPACPSIVVITSESDLAISMIPVDQLIADWNRTRPNSVTTYTFPASGKVIHDFIDPRQPDQKVDLVYPKLLEFFP